MFEKIMDSREEQSFMAPGEIEIDIALKKKQRKDGQNKLFAMLKDLLEKNGFDDAEFLKEFSRWGATEREFVGEIEDRFEYAEQQVLLLVREAEIFAEPGLTHNRSDLIAEALSRLEGSEEAGYYDGALYDAEQEINAGFIDRKIMEDIESRIVKLKKKLSEGSQDQDFKEFVAD